MGVREARPLWKRWAARVGLATCLAATLTYVPYRLLDPGDANRIEELRGELADRRAAIAAVREDNARLRRDIEALRNDPNAVLDIARRELGMVWPDEIVIRIERAPADESPAAESPP